jgi:hypothetical protein
MDLREALIEVWKQAMVERAGVVTLEGKEYAVRRTASKSLRQVDFVFEGRQLRGLEQNPKTRSRWAELARVGKKVMQFLENGRYIGVVVDGKATMYGGSGG